jgi:dihydroorotate dehydrogenase electron transfer subunit
MLGVYLVWLESPQIAASARPGQFVMVHCGEETVLRRPLSIHQVDKTKAKLALLFTVVGKGTHWLSRRKVGDNMDLLGPLGNGFSIHPTTRNLLLVAGGIGITPLRFLAQAALDQELLATLLLGAANTSRLYPKNLLPSGIELVTTTASPDGQKGMVTEFLPDFTSQTDQIFACGPMPMYREMADKYHRLLKDKPVQISLEMRMGCGLGVCYGCTVKAKNGLKQVCQDGPVFDLEDILWDELTYV